MKLYKVKNIFNKIKDRTILFCNFPHFWACTIIVVFSIVTLFISRYFHRLGQEYISSIFANIFAGLLTGLIICLISGVKNVYIAKLQNKKNWFEHIRSMIEEYNMLYQELIQKPFVDYNGDEELFDFIYDVGSHANWVNDEILQSSYNKLLSFNPREYCRKYLNYDAYLLADDFSELHDNLYEIDINTPSKKEILHYFEKVNNKLKKLYSATYYQVQDITIKLEVSTKLII